MKRSQPAKRGEPAPAKTAGEVQQGAGRSPATDDRLKRGARRHPQRDEPKIDSVEPGDTPG